MSTGNENANIVDLIGQLTSQASHLAQQQVNLVQAEMRDSVTDLKIALGAMIGAAVVGIGGLGVVLMGLAYWLDQAIDNLALSTLIVGLVTLAIAFVMFAGAKKKMSAANLTPDRTIDTLERTPDAATGNLTARGNI